VAAMSIAPPVAAEYPVIILAAIPIAANAVGNGEPVAIFPIARPIAMVAAITLGTAPDIVPLLKLAIDQFAILRAAIAGAINSVVVAQFQKTASLIVRRTVRLILAGALEIPICIRGTYRTTVGIAAVAERAIAIGR